MHLINLAAFINVLLTSFEPVRWRDLELGAGILPSQVIVCDKMTFPFLFKSFNQERWVNLVIKHITIRK